MMTAAELIAIVEAHGGWECEMHADPSDAMNEHNMAAQMPPCRSTGRAQIRMDRSALRRRQRGRVHPGQA